MSNTTLVIPLLTAITAALIAALTSFIVTVLSKEQKTSEFRQAWIDALRNDIADLDSHIGAFLSYLADTDRDWDRQKIDAYIDARYSELRTIESLHVRIRLRLNPEEHGELLRRINACRAYLERDSMFDVKEYNSLSDALVAEAQAVLKREWERVKKGEPTFVLVKRTAIVVVALGTIAIGWLIFH